MIKLPDVSEFQSGATAPNWPGIKAANGGAAIIRVGYGNAHLDKMFVSNYTALKANGFKFIGLYQYLRADQDATSQANAFCNWVGPVSALFPGSIPMLDLEEGSGDQSGRANTWLNIVDDFYGLNLLPLNKRSWLYSGQFFAMNHGLAPIFNSARHTWIAAYQSFDAGLLPHTLWQSTDGVFGANITNWPGAGRCDTSVGNLDLATLAAMAYQPSSSNPVPTDSEDMPMYGEIPGDGSPVVPNWLGGTISEVVIVAPNWDKYANAPTTLTVEITVNHTASSPFVTTVDVPKVDGHYTVTYDFANPGDVNGVVLRLVDAPFSAPVGYHLNK